MNGAHSLVHTFINNGLEVCFANPGTSEMHFVAALDQIEGMRCVLCLAEGVVSGAADGYARMADKPAATLLHLGPGLGNALANLHNAKKARTPMINVVGEHATHHRQYDSPLKADIQGIATPVSDWVKTPETAAAVGQAGAEAISAARTPPGQIATLILPADTAWGDGGKTGTLPAIPQAEPIRADAVDKAAEMLRAQQPTLILLGGMALHEEALATAGDIVATTGVDILAEVFNARHQRGAGRLAVRRIPYPVPQACKTLSSYKQIILVGATRPIAFFAYPDTGSEIVPPDCAVHTLAKPGQDCDDALQRVAKAMNIEPGRAVLQKPARPDQPSGPLTRETIGAAIGATLPENAIVVDESITTGRDLHDATAGAPPHDWLQNRGGSIGIGLPLATGAAIACPDRKVLCLESDGSGMYYNQALWTQARENLDITTLVFANHAYNILKYELANVGAGTSGPRAHDMLSLDRPKIDWISLANGMGVTAERVETAQDLCRAIKTGLATKGPYLIEVVMAE